MTITEVRFTPREEGNLVGYFSMVLDGDLVVSDGRLVRTSSGYLVVMPSRKTTIRCHRCHKNHPWDNAFCPTCGERCGTLDPLTLPMDSKGRPIRFKDVVHPANPEFRSVLAEAVMSEFRKVTNEEKTTQPGRAPDRFSDLDP